jgi:protein subunit release factor A
MINKQTKNKIMTVADIRAEKNLIELKKDAAQKAKIAVHQRKIKFYDSEIKKQKELLKEALDRGYYAIAQSKINDILRLDELSVRSELALF